MTGVDGVGSLSSTLTLTNPPVKINLKTDGTIDGTNPYKSEITGTLDTNVTNTITTGPPPEERIYVANKEVILYANKKVKKATLKTGSIVVIRSTDYKLTSNTVVNFDMIAEFFPTLP